MTAKQQILQFLYNNSFRAVWFSPTEIGMECGKTYTQASSWACGPLKALIKEGKVVKSNLGKGSRYKYNESPVSIEDFENKLK